MPLLPVNRKQLMTNKLNVKFAFDAINADFSFFMVSSSDKKSIYNAKYLDPHDKPYIQSLVYLPDYVTNVDSVRRFFIMTARGAISQSKLLKELRELDAKNGANLSIEQCTPENLEHYILLQLLLNSLAHATDVRAYNNVTGKLLISSEQFPSKRLGDKLLWLDALEVRVDKDMCLDLSAHRMTSVAPKCRNRMELSPRKTLLDYPLYDYAYVNETLKRVTVGSLKDIDALAKNNKVILIQKPFRGDKADIPFINFKDYARFLGTKSGALYNLAILMHDRLAKYFNIEFKKFDIERFLPGERQKISEYCKLAGLSLEQGLVIIDTVRDTQSKAFIDRICARIRQQYPDLKYTFGSSLVQGKMNLVCVRKPSEYANNELPDPYLGDQCLKSVYAIQHIIIDDDNLDEEVRLDTAIKELLIKQDLRLGRLRLFDWTQAGEVFQADWTFIWGGKQGVFSMTIHPDGYFDMKKIEPHGKDMSDYVAYTAFLNKQFYYKRIGKTESSDDVKITYYAGELVRDSQGNINRIQETDMFPLPVFVTIGEILANVSNEREFRGCDLIELCRRKLAATEEKTQKSLLKTIIDDIDPEKIYDKKSIFNSIAGRDQRKAQVLNKVLQEHTGEHLVAYLRNKAMREQLFSGVTDINCFNVPGDHHAAYYCVGPIGGGMRDKMESGSVIRRVEAVDGSELFFDKLLSLMNVTFVRLGRLTVVPFPFKYLREYAQTFAEED